MDDHNHNNGYDPWFVIFFLGLANYGKPMKDIAIGLGIGILLGIAIVVMSIYL